MSIVGMALIIFPSITMSALAAELPEQPVIASHARGSEAIPYADHIVIRTRTHNGVWQYRRWNATRAYWVDPYWIDM